MAKPVSFKAFVLKQKPDDSPAGEFVRATEADKSFTDDDRWGKIRFYLLQRDGGDHSLYAARLLWRAYQNDV
jgi:hypothetical protein